MKEAIRDHAKDIRDMVTHRSPVIDIVPFFQETPGDGRYIGDLGLAIWLCERNRHNTSGLLPILQGLSGPTYVQEK
jgi:hypothetical protein